MVQVRIAEERDLADLLSLYAQLSPGGELPASDLAAARMREMRAWPGLTLFVATVDRGVVGTVTLVVVPNLTHGGRSWAQVENMVVDERHRGTGAGRALLDACRSVASEAGCYKLQLQSANQRDGAHRFYESCGFNASSLGFRLYLA